MTISEKISDCLDPAFGIPTDVRFVFQRASNVIKEVNAHKFVLAIGSEVFKKEFYGSMKESKEEIEIKDASPDVFKTMVDFMYSKELHWKDYALSYLSSLYDLGERYDILELREEIINSITKHEVTDITVLEVAVLAEEYILHRPLSEALYDSASSFLKKKFDVKAFDFCSENEATELHGLVMEQDLWNYGGTQEDWT